MTMPMGSAPINNDNETVQAKIAEIRMRGLSLDATIAGMAELEIALANKNKTIDNLRDANWISSRALEDFKKSVIASLMEADLGDYTRECIFDDLGLEQPSLNWRISFDVEIEYGTDLDSLISDVEHSIARISGVTSVDHNDSEEL